jgi:hypothetical protein
MEFEVSTRSGLVARVFASIGCATRLLQLVTDPALRSTAKSGCATGLFAHGEGVSRGRLLRLARPPAVYFNRSLQWREAPCVKKHSQEWLCHATRP